MSKQIKDLEKTVKYLRGLGNHKAADKLEKRIDKLLIREQKKNAKKT